MSRSQFMFEWSDDCPVCVLSVVFQCIILGEKLVPILFQTGFTRYCCLTTYQHHSWRLRHAFFFFPERTFVKQVRHDKSVRIFLFVLLVKEGSSVRMFSFLQRSRGGVEVGNNGAKRCSNQTIVLWLENVRTSMVVGLACLANALAPLVLTMRNNGRYVHLAPPPSVPHPKIIESFVDIIAKHDT